MHYNTALKYNNIIYMFTWNNLVYYKRTATYKISEDNKENEVMNY